MSKNCYPVLLCLLLNLFVSCSEKMAEQVRPRIDLSGSWAFRLDSLEKGLDENWQSASIEDSLLLPGTTDTNKKGILNEKMDETTFLSREYKYVGKAWYMKTVNIPDDWRNKHIQLYMERTKPTTVWVDDHLIGKNDHISTSQIYDLSDILTPGQHKIVILVDNGNSVPPQLLSNSHAYTESTQTNWNGIIGDFYLEASDQCYIEDIQIYPNVKNHSATIKVKIKNNLPDASNAEISFYAESWNSPKKHKTGIISQSIDLAKREFSFELDLGKNVLLWSEFTPSLYRLAVTLQGEKIQDTQYVDFGMREFSTRGTQFVINDKITFLRGKHDACVFPLTAHVAMDTETWRHYFKVAKSYGINHYRFHSWCPPKACFEAANIEGIYLQPELPFWGSFKKDDRSLISFLQKEGINIQNEYSNNPSFVMFALGNELSGDQEVMNDFVNLFRKVDDRHLYAYGSNNYLGFRGHIAGEDYLTSCRVGGDNDNSFATHARGSFSFADAYDGGYINHTYPNSEMDFSTAVEKCSVPIISHETGQFQIYPDYEEMKKYTGVLKPRNFSVFKERLRKAGMEDQAKDFLMASGKWAVSLYRAEIEMDLRTRGFGGFQLLDLQDYPGQGSAYVGILDAFMESKGLITPEEWRSFCCEVVPLFVTEKFCWTSNERLKGDIRIANYSANELKGKRLKWVLQDTGEQVLDKGEIAIDSKQGDVTMFGEITPDISSVTKATKLELILSLEGTPYRNTYPLWIYPAEVKTSLPSDILVTKELNPDIRKHLENGGKVLWFPQKDRYASTTVGGLFQTDYWNYRMFKSICESINKPVSPGTLGLLTNPEHPLFNDFPTEAYTNWQWFPIVKQSYPMILDRLPAKYRPIVQVIDNIERNHKLGLIFEFEIGKGKVLICMSDLESVKEKPEARQLYHSMVNYMSGNEFNPKFNLTINALDELFSTEIKTGKIDVLNNISYE